MPLVHWMQLGHSVDHGTHKDTSSELYSTCTSTRAPVPQPNQPLFHEMLGPVDRTSTGCTLSRRCFTSQPNMHHLPLLLLLGGSGWLPGGGG